MQEQFSLFPDEEMIGAERQYKIVKANSFIQKARFKLSLKQQKIILYAISQIKPNSQRGDTYTIDIPHLCRVCGIEYSTENYKHVYKNIEAIKKASFWFKPEGKTRYYIDWITNVSVVETNAEQDINITNPRAVSFKFDSRLEDYLIELSKNFTSYEINDILPMKSAYSIRMYELLRSYANLGKCVLQVGEIYELLQVSEKYSFKEFNRRVIQKALEEINRYTCFDIVANQLRTGHRVTAIEFIISAKDENKRDIAILTANSAIEKRNKRVNERMIKALGG